MQKDYITPPPKQQPHGEKYPKKKKEKIIFKKFDLPP